MPLSRQTKRWIEAADADDTVSFFGRILTKPQVKVALMLSLAGWDAGRIYDIFFPGLRKLPNSEAENRGPDHPDIT